MDVNALKELIEKEVATGQCEIRYGDATNPGGMYDGLAIRLQPTLGGMQYRVCQVTPSGEGSGMYDPDPAVAASMAMDLMKVYTKPHPNPMVQAMLAKKKRPELTFYTIPRK